MEFQQRLYELRKKAGLSQEGLADLGGGQQAQRHHAEAEQLEDEHHGPARHIDVARQLGHQCINGPNDRSDHRQKPKAGYNRNGQGGEAEERIRHTMP